MSEVADGLVVYDPARDRVHYLNASASVVFTLCDGARSRELVVEVAARMLGAERASAKEVEACIAQLENEGVLGLDE